MSDINDSYKTIEKPSQGIYKEKGSKFTAFAFPVFSEEEIKEHIHVLRDEYYNARHHCFAWQLGLDGTRYRTNDDGEPSGTAGKPILGQLNSHELTNILVVVVRYFGGTKLGMAGLIRAYKEATIDAINNAVVLQCTVNDTYKVYFEYPAMNDIMKIVKEESLHVIEQQFDLSCCVVFSLRQSETAKVIERLESIESAKCEYICTR